ncbi:RNA polymerase sigma factor [Porcipelethomonas sp.]|uniref:RNA polymerase sigma factor n=1 Tax=Porcipelethomonas sp. TaxID=2981675 RepID=UPI003EF32000
MNDFELLYNEYFSKIYGFAVNLCKNKELAEDITSETFVRAIIHYKKTDENKNVNTWLCQIAKNIYLDYLRKQSKISGNEIPEIADNTSIENIVSNNESCRQIHKILHKTEEPYKEVFTLRVFGELSFKEIGEVFEKSENWARVTFFRAKKKIQTELEKENDL